MQKNIFERKPILLVILLTVIIAFVILIDKFNFAEQLKGAIYFLGIMGVVAYFGWLNHNIINLKYKVSNLEDKLSNTENGNKHK